MFHLPSVNYVPNRFYVPDRFIWRQVPKWCIELKVSFLRVIKFMAQPTQTDPQFKLRLPADLKDRIESAASQSNRSMNAEIVAALEGAYPPPIRALFDYPLPDLGMLALHWHSGAWHYVNWDDWHRLRTRGENSGYFSKWIGQASYFVVVVVDGENQLCNLIVNHVLITSRGFEDVGFSLLTKAEKDDYAQLMTAVRHLPGDEDRLSELREKMLPAYRLPQNTIPKLKEILLQLATEETVDTLIKSRCA